MLLWMAKAIIFNTVKWFYKGRGEDIAEALNVSVDQYREDYAERYDILIEALEKNERTVPVLLYKYLGDHEGQNYYTIREYELKEGILPEFRRNEQLDFIYDYLMTFGYEPSEEELAVKNGTSEMYRKIFEEEGK